MKKVSFVSILPLFSLFYGHGLYASQSSSSPTPVVQPQAAVLVVPLCTLAENKEIRVTVTQTNYFKDKGYLAKDKNWIQLSVRVENKTAKVISLSDTKAKQSTGTALASAESALELAKPPSATGEAAKTTAIVGAGQFAGFFIFPPLALASSAFALFGNMGGVESWSKRINRIEKNMLRSQAIAPNTAAEGLVYVPALKTFDSLIVFYSTGPNLTTLNVPCNSKA